MKKLNKGTSEYKNAKFCIVCSSGGHLTHMYMLKDIWAKHDRVWVTFNKTDANSILEDENKYYCHYPTNRNIPNLIKNTFLAVKVLNKEKTRHHNIVRCCHRDTIFYYWKNKRNKASLYRGLRSHR